VGLVLVWSSSCSWSASSFGRIKAFFALFIAAALSTTAFPVMARILKDRNITQMCFGQLSLGSAAGVEVFAWILLAFVVAMVGSGDGYAGLLKTGVGVIVLVAFVYLALKPAFSWFLRTHGPDGEPTTAVVTSPMIGLPMCAMLTEWLHLHTVFGAFLFGTCLDRLLGSLAKRIEPLSIVVLSPDAVVLRAGGSRHDRKRIQWCRLRRDEPDRLRRSRRQSCRGCRRCASGRVQLARQSRDWLADECARTDRPQTVHDAARDGPRNDGDDRATDDAVRGARTCAGRCREAGAAGRVMTACALRGLPLRLRRSLVHQPVFHS
jgi:hypothetical protein